MKTYIIDNVMLFENKEYEFIVTDEFKENPILEINTPYHCKYFISLMTGNIFGKTGPNFQLVEDEMRAINQYMRQIDNHNEEFSMWFSYISEYIQDEFTDDEYKNLLSYMRLYKSQLLIPNFTSTENKILDYKSWINSLKEISKGGK